MIRAHESVNFCMNSAFQYLSLCKAFKEWNLKWIDIHLFKGISLTLIINNCIKVIGMNKV